MLPSGSLNQDTAHAARLVDVTVARRVRQVVVLESNTVGFGGLRRYRSSWSPTAHVAPVARFVPAKSERYTISLECRLE